MYINVKKFCDIQGNITCCDPKCKYDNHEQLDKIEKSKVRFEPFKLLIELNCKKCGIYFDFEILLDSIILNTKYQG